MRPRALAILPTYNERDNLGQIVPAILAQADVLDLLVVDDNSPDGTGQLADTLALAEPRVSVLHRAGKRGLGSAYVAGFKWALERGYAFICEMDADFSHDPADLPRLLAAAQHSDLVIGSRWVRGGGVRNWSLLRQFISRGGSLYARAILGLPVHDLTSGFKCFRAETLAALDLDAVRSNGYAFQIELNYLCARRGDRLQEVPIIFVDRRVGESKMSSAIVLEAMAVVWRLRRQGRRVKGEG
ncbi:MAG: polyprenol monophosphomannose synthase [Chloroflexi bacterium]|nr:polyprenol monophosphomannose synthase [Chloroflexota bacterium]